jgi:uncharacterized protein YqjF (DUF2071 family)
MYQSWRDLLFLHWEWDADDIQRSLPSGLRVDRHDGRCYLGVVPFKMRRVRPRFVPPMPGVSDFLELNFRTYAYDASGTPGVWFYSLDANQRLAVAVARRFFHLPYHWARMRVDADRYRAIGSERRAQPGSLEFFLLERYVLFAETKRGLQPGRVHHEPYPFRDVELFEWDEGLFSLNGFEPPRRAPRGRGPTPIWSRPTVRSRKTVRPSFRRSSLNARRHSPALPWEGAWYRSPARVRFIWIVS